MSLRSPDRMSAFLMIWFGQFVSTVGTRMTALALAFWAFDVTGRASELGLIVFFAIAPGTILGPIAGALLDRWNRRRMLIACDVLAGWNREFSNVVATAIN